MKKSTNEEKMAVSLKAVDLIKSGDIVGLGSGTTMAFVIQELGNRWKNGLNFTAVPSSLKTEALARSFGIPMIEIGQTSHIDITLDGADEFTEQLYLIKGGGGALFREKIIASLSQRNVILTDSSKKVDLLGKFKVPVEVSPYAIELVKNRLVKMNGFPTLRLNSSLPFTTDNGNYIIDVDFGLIDNPENLASQLDGVVGIIEHGLFINLTDEILMANGDQIISFS